MIAWNRNKKGKMWMWLGKIRVDTFNQSIKATSTTLKRKHLDDGILRIKKETAAFRKLLTNFSGVSN